MSAPRPFRDLCPEGDERDAMTDDEFWARVTAYLQGPDGEDYQPLDHLPVVRLQAEPCRECGELGACSYDSEGRALIHAITDDDTEDEDS